MSHGAPSCWVPAAALCSPPTQPPTQFPPSHRPTQFHPTAMAIQGGCPSGAHVCIPIPPAATAPPRPLFPPAPMSPINAKVAIKPQCHQCRSWHVAVIFFDIGRFADVMALVIACCMFFRRCNCHSPRCPTPQGRLQARCMAIPAVISRAPVC